MPRGRHWSASLASINALAGAAIAAAAGSSEAAIISHTTPGFIAPYGYLPLPGSNYLSFSILRTGNHFSGSGTLRRGRLAGFSFHTTSTVVARGAQFRLARVLGSNYGVALANKGQTFNQVGTRIGAAAFARWHYRFSEIGGLFKFSSPSGRTVTKPLTGSGISSLAQHIRGRQYVTTSMGRKYTYVSFTATRRTATYGPSNFSDAYALFRFNVGSQTDYGWLEISQYNSLTSSPTVDILAYGYDTSGRPIAAGAVVPEPRELPLALGAFVLGAVGVREWRKRQNDAP